MQQLGPTASKYEQAEVGNLRRARFLALGGVTEKNKMMQLTPFYVQLRQGRGGTHPTRLKVLSANALNSISVLECFFLKVKECLIVKLCFD